MGALSPGRAAGPLLWVQEGSLPCGLATHPQAALEPDNDETHSQPKRAFLTLKGKARIFSFFSLREIPLYIALNWTCLSRRHV